MKRHEALLLKDLQRAMKDGAPVKTQEHPAMILEKTDPPEIPEMKVEPMLPSVYTGQDAIRYLTKLALIQQRGRKEKEGGEAEKEKEEVKTRKHMDDNRVSELQLNKSSGSEVPVGTSVESVSSSKSTNKSDVTEPPGPDPHRPHPPDNHDEGGPGDGGGGLSASSTTSNPSPQTEEPNPKTESTWLEEEQDGSPVHSDPQDATGSTTPSKSGKDQQPLAGSSSSHDAFLDATSSGDDDAQDYSDGKDASQSALENKGTITVQSPTEQERDKHERDERDRSESGDTSGDPDLELNDKELELNSESSETNQEENTQADSRSHVQSQRNQHQAKAKSPAIGRQGRTQNLDMSSVKVGSDDDDFDFDPELERLIAETAKTINEQKTPVPRRVPAKIKSRNDIREEETRKRFPGIRPWPTLEECMQSPLPKYIVFTSTWLSVTAKGVK